MISGKYELNHIKSGKNLLKDSFKWFLQASIPDTPVDPVPPVSLDFQAHKSESRILYSFYVASKVLQKTYSVTFFSR